MAIFKCNACNHIQEVDNSHIGRRAKCPKCKEEFPIYNTVNYIKKLTEKFYLQQKQLNDLQEELKNSAKTENRENTLEIYDSIPIDDLNIHNTDLFSQESQYSPVKKWFKDKGIEATIDPRMMDTTGFFDEVAVHIGDQFDILSPIINQIKYIQGKKYDTVKITLSKKSNDEIKQITDFCKMLYNYAFIAKYYFQKKDKVVYLTLHEIPRIRGFFNGLWMEWFVLIKLLTLFTENNMTPAIARGINIAFNKNDKNELDIFFLNSQGDPICIECKTGEFRQDLNKYFSLQKKLHIKKENFILCVFGLSEEQAYGLTNMYEITLVNESTLLPHIEKFL